MNRKTSGTRPRSTLSSVTPVTAPIRTADNRAAPQIDSAGAVDLADASQTKPSTHWEFWILRGLFTVLIGVLCYAFAPSGLRGSAAGVGLLLALVIVLAEYRLAYASLGGLVWGGRGGPGGMSAALLLRLIISRTSQPLSPK